MVFKMKQSCLDPSNLDYRIYINNTHIEKRRDGQIDEFQVDC